MSDDEWYDDFVVDDIKFIEIKDLDFGKEYKILKYTKVNFQILSKIFLNIEDEIGKKSILILNEYTVLPPVAIIKKMKLRRNGNSLSFKEIDTKKKIKTESNERLIDDAEFDF